MDVPNPVDIILDSEKFAHSINQGLQLAFKEYKHSQYNRESFAIWVKGMGSAFYFRNKGYMNVKAKT